MPMISQPSDFVRLEDTKPRYATSTIRLKGQRWCGTYSLLFHHRAHVFDVYTNYGVDLLTPPRDQVVSAVDSRNQYSFDCMTTDFSRYVHDENGSSVELAVHDFFKRILLDGLWWSLVQGV